MRALLAALALAAMTLLDAMPAAASCAPPASVGENAARAEAVAYGTVTSTERGAIIVRVDRVLKGQVAGTLRVFVGPGRGGAAGSAIATSIDYPDLRGPAAVGSDHVLYLIRGSDGQLETNACIGSHPGQPDAAELTYFGAGTSPAPASPLPRTASGPDPSLSLLDVPALWLSAILLAIFGGAMVMIRRRRAA
jgi:hypothetical protein